MEIIYSNSVRNVLDRMYLEAVVLRGTSPKEYGECIDAIESIPNSIVTSQANRPLCWAREKADIICPNRYWFSYKRFSNAILVDEVYDSKTGQILTESLLKVLSLIERVEKL